MVTSNPVYIDYTPLTHQQKIQNELYTFPKKLKGYVLSLFPILQWIHRYNLSWLVQDAIAGITVGMLIVPQGIAYAKIANLDPQYGLYTSFVGVTLYCFFGTSKDISIGPITVVSLLVGQAISKVTTEHPEISGPEVAVCLSLFAGIVTLLIGLIRIGMLVDFISEPAIAGYMTGSAITISLGQWPKVFGLAVNTHNAPYLIVYEFFEKIKDTKLDAAFGLVALVALYVIKLGGAKLADRCPVLKKPLFFLGIMRSGLIVIIGTFISYLINVHHKSAPLISIIETVPAGFDAMGVPSLSMTVLKEASGVLPSIILILILEHVSVAKSFGRMNNYSIDPNQEILAIGMSNIVGSFFGAYPCTGAFSRTAVMARSGAKTPMAGVFSGAVVLLALYVLTPAFFYIPEAVLGSVVIHAVVDLVSGPTFLKELWHASICEFFIFVIAVVITCFMDVETGIYVSVGLSLLLMLLKLARPSVSSLGRVRLDAHAPDAQDRQCVPSIASVTSTAKDMYESDKHARYIYVEEKDPLYTRLLDPLPSGVVVIRLSHSILYPNANYIAERMMDIVKSRTRSGHGEIDTVTSEDIKEETVWNQPSANQEDVVHRHALKPYLECIVLDFSAVDKLDATALHTLHSMQQTLDRYAGGKTVEWHFCHIMNTQVRQLLIQSGFGLTERIASSVEMKISQREERPKYGGGGGACADRSLQTIHSLRDPMMALVDDAYYFNVDAAKNHQCESIIGLLPVDRYTAFHWDLEAAIYYISEKRQNSLLDYQDNNLSSVTVTTTY